MEVFLQIVGLVTLILIGLAAVAYAGFSLWVKWQVGRATKIFDQLGGVAVPLEVKLKRVEKLAWRKPGPAQAAEASLAAMGLEPCGAFESQSTPGLFVSAFVDRQHSLYAVVCEHPASRPWVDFYQEAPDGSGITVTNQVQGSELPSPEWSEKIVLKDKPAEALHQEMLRAIVGRKAAPATVEGFQECFEGAYRRSMEWQMKAGLVNNPLDIAAAAELTGLAADEETLEAAQEIFQTRLQSAREAYLTQAGLSAVEWDRQHGSTFFVTEDDSIETLAEMLEEWADGEYEAPFRLPKGPPLELFPQMIKDAGLEGQVELISSLAEPVRCDVYRFEAESSAEED